MLDRKMLESLGGCEGYRVERVVWPEEGVRTLSIYLKPTAKVMHCEQCGA
ncbi:MAG: ISL3 family transposase, partial [Xanthomonadaceae bacterium]|nr:ISL3 family transposase [Xanthomonadaceae bacterium]